VIPAGGDDQLQDLVITEVPGEVGKQRVADPAGRVQLVGEAEDRRLGLGPDRVAGGAVHGGGELLVGESHGPPEDHQRVAGR